MKAKLAIVCTAAALLLPAAGFAADPESKKIDEFVSDSMLTTRIKAEMALDKPSTLVDFSVRTDKSGAVVLTGVAKTQADKDKAELVARRVDGVKTVQNNIQLRSE